MRASVGRCGKTSEGLLEMLGQENRTTCEPFLGVLRPFELQEARYQHPRSDSSYASQYTKNTGIRTLFNPVG